MSVDSTREKIAIIGAGPVGLSAARALKEKGIAYDQFEAGTAVGGNWRDGVYTTAHIISSRKTTEYPDYPMPSHYPDFPSASQMLAYLEDYARHYGLEGNIEFSTRVESVLPTADELWELRLSNGSTRIYEGVVICNGHHWDRRYPKYPGEFTGEIIHSKDYKHPDQLKGKRILVIGGGNSACDIVAEAARVGSSAHLSLRRGYWFLPKTFFSIPTSELLTTWLPVWMQRMYIGALVRIVVGDYRNYGLMKPDHKLFDHHPTINTEVLHYLKHGRITPHPDVQSFSANTVIFSDGVREDFDLIVCATGFHVSLPFLKPGIVDTNGSIANVRWGVVAPHHRQLYVYGWGQARYGFGPLLTPASDAIAELIIAQRNLKHPLGKLLHRMHQPFPRTHLLDPMATLREIKAIKKLLWLLPILDRYLMPREIDSPALAAKQSRERIHTD